MFLYVYGVETKEQSELLVKEKADAIGIRLSGELSAVNMEACREIFLSLPVNILRVGIFWAEPAWEIEELITFCHLDALQFLSPRGDILRYDKRTFAGDFSPDANAWTARVNDTYTLEKLKTKAEKKPTIIVGDYSVSEWKEIIDTVHPFGVAINIQHFLPEIARYIKSI